MGRERKVLPAVEARIVRMRKRGMSFQEIAAKLTKDGVPAPTTDSWGWTTIKRVVRPHIK
ncbi:MAG: recombinase family protein [Candidatus Dormibacteraceae bacterium]